MLITNTFTSSKQVTSNNDCPSASSACKKSTSTSSHRGVETASVSLHRQTTATSSSSLPPLTPSEAITLNLFLRSSRSIAPLRIADIQGVIDETTGEQSSPAVRKGRIRTSTSSSSSTTISTTGIQCCIIDSFPFDKCEIVATVVKKNAIYRQARPLYDSHDKGKGREISNDTLEDASPPKEEIQLIFYELDDDSGASITCCVNPAKVYAREISDSKRRQASHHSQRNGHCNEEYSTTDSESIEDECLSNSTPRASLAKRGSDDDDEDNEDTARKVEQAKPKFDPRLWIYRYREPPRPLPSSSTSSTSSNSSAAAFEIPLYKEGTILRIIGKIFINPQRGNERQIEVSSVECAYEEGYINEYRRKVPPRGNKYTEWHHAIKCKKKRKELFGDKEKVREFIGFGVPKERDGGESSRNSQSTTMQNVTMQDVTLPSFNETHNTTSVSHISSTSLLNATHLPVKHTSTTTITTSMSSTTGTKRKRAKLPSCSTLYKQKIPITKEIFCLYAHQYFRDLDKSARKSSTDRILPKNLHDQSMQDEGSVGCQSNGRVSLAQMKEDKILKWLAEIYARTEARRQAAVLETSLITPDNSMATPKPKNRYIPNTAESSVILPSSSPSHSLYHQRSIPRADMLMQDTTNRSISSSTSSGDTKEKKIKLKAEVVDKIRNDLFRSTILRLVKDGIIVVFPADLSSIPTSFAATRHQDLTMAPKRAEECQTCKLKLKKEIDKIPPHLMTMDGITLRQYTASLHAAQICDCPPSSTSITQSKLPLRVQREEVYALLTAEMLLPVVEGVVARMGPQMGVEVQNVWHTVRKTDDMWRFVSREVVKECLEMI